MGKGPGQGCRAVKTLLRLGLCSEGSGEPLRFKTRSGCLQLQFFRSFGLAQRLLQLSAERTVAGQGQVLGAVSDCPGWRLVGTVTIGAGDSDLRFLPPGPRLALSPHSCQQAAFLPLPLRNCEILCWIPHRVPAVYSLPLKAFIPGLAPRQRCSCGRTPR